MAHQRRLYVRAFWVFRQLFFLAVLVLVYLLGHHLFWSLVYLRCLCDFEVYVSLSLSLSSSVNTHTHTHAHTCCARSLVTGFVRRKKILRRVVVVLLLLLLLLRLRVGWSIASLSPSLDATKDASSACTHSLLN